MNLTRVALSNPVAVIAAILLVFLLGTIGLIWRLMLYRREVAIVWDGKSFAVAGRAEYFSHRFREELATMRDLLKGVSSPNRNRREQEERRH